jgi:hypothetical protein
LLVWRRIFYAVSGVKQAPVLALIVLAVAGCASSHPTSGGTVPSTPDDTAIARVQGDGRFGIFPNSQTRAGCLIPGPGLSLGIKGTCQTRVSHEVRHSGRLVTVVTFTEYWPARKFRTHGPPTGTLQHSWRMEIRAGGRIVSGGSDGDFAPQSAI